MGKSVKGNIVDVFNKKIFPGEIIFENGEIISIENSDDVPDQFVLPGFIDAHVHIESSMLVPSEFARVAVRHGTVGTVSDPHEIANVLGVEGVLFMMQNAAEVPFKFYFGAPSCVPATQHETSGGIIGMKEIEELLSMREIRYLSEVMDYPGVVNRKGTIMEKIEAAKKEGKPIDGHAPGLRGEDLKKYVSAGISTDHECTSREEAEEKLGLGMKILIREGSAAGNMKELIDLVNTHPDEIMLCTDDIHPGNLIGGHIAEMVKYGIAMGMDVFDMLRAASVNPVLHYGLDVGLMRPGDPADFILIDDFVKFTILETYIDGNRLYGDQAVMMKKASVIPVNLFHARKIKPECIAVAAGTQKIRVIVAEDNQLVTGSEISIPRISDGIILPDPERDILKIVVLDRYTGRPPAVGFIRGFGFKKGAIAGSVSHDCHNVIAVGVCDADLCTAVNKVIECQGGLVVAAGDETEFLPLPVAGLMSDMDADFVAGKMEVIEEKVSGLGSRLKSPFMTLSFMALLVIPKLKMSDRGLFDSEAFSFTSVWV